MYNTRDEISKFRGDEGDNYMTCGLSSTEIGNEKISDNYIKLNRENEQIRVEKDTNMTTIRMFEEHLKQKTVYFENVKEKTMFRKNVAAGKEVSQFKKNADTLFDPHATLVKEAFPGIYIL